MKPLTFSSPDGATATITKVLTKRKHRPTLKEAQDFVGGSVEMAPIRNKPMSDEPVQLLVNEDGIPLRLPVNPQASLTAGYPIYGNALVLQGEACWQEA